MKPSNYFGEDSKPADVIIQFFHNEKVKMVDLKFAKDGYILTMIDCKETNSIILAYDCSDSLCAYNT